MTKKDFNVNYESTEQQQIRSLSDHLSSINSKHEKMVNIFTWHKKMEYFKTINKQRGGKKRSTNILFDRKLKKSK
jgi:hypothetical protein